MIVARALKTADSQTVRFRNTRTCAEERIATLKGNEGGHPSGVRFPTVTSAVLRLSQPTIGSDVLTSEAIQDLEFRRATESDVDGIADAHRDSILHLGSRYYVPAIVNEWAGVVHPGLYLDAMDRGEIFFIATGVVAGHRLVLGFSSDYVISDTTHGTSAYVRPAAARRRVGSRLLAMAEAFGRARGATAVRIEASLGAVEFYKCQGFVETGCGDVALPSGFKMPCVFMRKELL